MTQQRRSIGGYELTNFIAGFVTALVVQMMQQWAGIDGMRRNAEIPCEVFLLADASKVGLRSDLRPRFLAGVAAL